MPRQAVNIEPYRFEIERQIAAGNTQLQIRQWLVTKGVSIGKTGFSKRIVSWGISRTTSTLATNPALISAIETAFHTTHHDDEMIAQIITTQGILTTPNQVKEVRLAHNWRRRAHDQHQATQHRTRTFILVEQALQLEECRGYGRELMKNYLRLKFHHDAREDDVRDALSILDEVGTASRKPGPKKHHMGGEYITPGKNFELGYAEDGRQAAIQRQGDRKTRTSFSAHSPVVHFSVGVARFLPDRIAKNGGEWETIGRTLSINEDNRTLSSDQLTKSLMAQARSQAKHPSMKTWLGIGDESDWSLAHNNPTKGLPRNIAPWAKPQLLSTAIEGGCYASSGTTTKLYAIWLLYMPEAPPTPERSLSPSPKPIKKESKKGKIETEPEAKREIKQEPTRSKRSRPMSAEMSIAKRPGLGTRGKAKVTEEFERYASEDAAAEDAAKNAAEEATEKDMASEDDAVTEHRDEYQTVEEMIDNAEGSDGEGSEQ